MDAVRQSALTDAGMTGMSFLPGSGNCKSIVEGREALADKLVFVVVCAPTRCSFNLFNQLVPTYDAESHLNSICTSPALRTMATNR